MATPSTNGESLLAINLGSAYIRAALFDVADGQYRLLAAGAVARPVHAPLHGMTELVFQALEQIQASTERALLDEQKRLIQPSRADGAGIDQVVLTTSMTPKLRLAAVGLLEETSLESARRLAMAAHAAVVESITLNDRRKPETQMDAILRAEPDVILLTGGSDNGASRPVFKLAELITLVCRVLPQEKRPEVLYAGNPALAEKMLEVLGKWTTVHTAPNVRPAADEERLGPALEVLDRAAWEIRGRQMEQFHSLAGLSQAPPLSAAWAFGRLVRWISQTQDSPNGALGVDLGASAATVAAAQAGRFSLEVLPDGLGSPMRRLAEEAHLEALRQWLPVPLATDVIRDYLWQKSLYPACLPLSQEALMIEQAAARLILQRALAAARRNWPGFPRHFDSILASGAVLSQAPTHGQALLMLLDGLQPLGTTDLTLDVNHLAVALGAAAGVNALLAVQVLDSPAFLHLGTVLCPISSAKPGTSILKIRMETADGTAVLREIRQGSLVQLPLPPGREARLHLELLQRTELDFGGGGRRRVYEVLGGACGVVIDARGRPLKLPRDEGQRCELLKKWRQALGG